MGPLGVALKRVRLLERDLWNLESVQFPSKGVRSQPPVTISSKIHSLDGHRGLSSGL